MTCKDCIHYEVCLNGICDEYFTEDTPQDLKVMFSPIGCETFKNKADYVEVPCRCKGCKYANEDGTICRYDIGRAVEPDHFCSYGERK